MIVTVDGPAGAGKSSVARALARELGFEFLDTGAMYRAVTLAAIHAEIALDEPRRVNSVAQQACIELRGDEVLLDGRDVTSSIRRQDVTNSIHYIADNPEVRERLGELQREFAGQRDIVTEGRDQGTVVFPAAECKIFLTASPEERARRRAEELRRRGEEVATDRVLAEQNERDRRDAARPVGALRRADDAVEVVTDGMTPEEVLAKLVQLVNERR